jgi:hypothetical protein
MYILSFSIFLVGVCLTGFNSQLAARFNGRRRHLSEEFMCSITRQNIAGVGAAFLFGSLMVIWIEFN